VIYAHRNICVIGVSVVGECNVHETAIRKASFNAWMGITRGDEVCKCCFECCVALRAEWCKLWT
jgi:hypothetical protein